MEKPSADFRRNQGDRMASNPRQLQIAHGQSAEVAEKLRKVKHVEHVERQRFSGDGNFTASPMRKCETF
jgi:hypothetical protein